MNEMHQQNCPSSERLAFGNDLHCKYLQIHFHYLTHILLGRSKPLELLSQIEVNIPLVYNRWISAVNAIQKSFGRIPYNSTILYNQLIVDQVFSSRKSNFQLSGNSFSPNLQSTFANEEHHRIGHLTSFGVEDIIASPARPMEEDRVRTLIGQVESNFRHPKKKITIIKN